MAVFSHRFFLTVRTFCLLFLLWEVYRKMEKDKLNDFYLKESVASLELEGHVVSDKLKAAMKSILDGEKSYDDVVADFVMNEVGHEQ